MKKILIASICFIALTASTNAQSKVIHNVSSDDFKRIINGVGVLIDLRTTDEINKKGQIKGAVQLDYLAKDAEQQIDKLDKKKTYFIYCAGGGRSGQCAEYMEKNGFKSVYNLEKGFSDWVQKGFPVEKK